MDFDPTKLKGIDLFADSRVVVFPIEPGYSVRLTLLTNGECLYEDIYDDFEDTLAVNAAERAMFSNNEAHGDMVKVASVPRWKVAQWEDEGDRKCNGDPECKRKYLNRMLNDPDNAKFRTNTWRV